MAEGRVFDSWKEIAEYLRRSSKTCQRWERELDLPIHRLDGSPKASVFAYQDELDRWLNEKLHERKRVHEKPAPSSGEVAGAPPTEAGQEMRSVAVLPFDNLTHDLAQDYFVEGIHESLITELAKLGSVRVTSRSSVLRYRGQRRDLKRVARELGVDALVEGAVLRTGDRVRVSAQLIRGDTDEHVWAQRYDRDVGDVLALLDEVSRAIANEIGRTMGGTESGDRPSVKKPHCVIPKAYEAYLRGRQILNQGGIVATLFPRVEHNFEEATRLDPDFAEAWGALAMNRAGQAFLGLRPPGEMLPLAREAARRALDLDERTGRAWAALGFISLYFD
jgi:TolB-like protein